MAIPIEGPRYPIRCEALPVSELSGLLITPAVLEVVEREALAAYPEECCGILIGRVAAGEPSIGKIQEVTVTGNTASDRRQERYAIEPEQLLRAHQAARARGLEVMGYYHSHPDQAAVPSQHDLETAWPDLNYLILAVHGERVTEVRCWRLGRTGGAFHEVEFEYP